MKKMLVIGGTGTIGRPLVAKALNHGYYVSIIGKGGGKDAPREAHYYECDRKNEVLFSTILKELSRNSFYEVVVDINAYNKIDSDIVVDSIGNKDTHFFVFSTTLVYDRSTISFRPISENHLLAPEGVQGGYVDGKIALERFWQKTGLNWTVLRPYHVLGGGSYLGCIPPHNRDPNLPQKLANREKIQLCDGGRIPLNVVHPLDLSEIILRSVNNSNTFRKAYNTVNPSEVLARDYFATIARFVGGVKLNYESVPAEQYWKTPTGWALTLLPHLYDTSKLEGDIGYVPNTPFSTCILAALRSPAAGDIPRLSELSVHQNMNKKPFPLEHRNYS